MTADRSDRDVDVLGYFPKDERDEFEIIRSLSRKTGELLIAQIILERELGPAEAPPTPKQSLWQRFLRRLRR